MLRRLAASVNAMFDMASISNYNVIMIRDLDTTLIRTFVTAADKASMTAAANALHLTQGAVSQQVKRLEEVLGQSLFERDRRGLRLTRSGERLLDKARRLRHRRQRSGTRSAVPISAAGAARPP